MQHLIIDLEKSAAYANISDLGPVIGSCSHCLLPAAVEPPHLVVAQHPRAWVDTGSSSAPCLCFTYCHTDTSRCTDIVIFLHPIDVACRHEVVYFLCPQLRPDCFTGHIVPRGCQKSSGLRRGWDSGVKPWRSTAGLLTCNSRYDATHQECNRSQGAPADGWWHKTGHRHPQGLSHLSVLNSFCYDAEIPVMGRDKKCRSF